VSKNGEQRMNRKAISKRISRLVNVKPNMLRKWVSLRTSGVSVSKNEFLCTTWGGARGVLNIAAD
jgi:hypothetical protein